MDRQYLSPSAPAPNALIFTESVHEVVLQMSIPAQIRKLVLYVSSNQGFVDEFVRTLTFAKHHYKHLV